MALVEMEFGGGGSGTPINIPLDEFIDLSTKSSNIRVDDFECIKNGKLVQMTMRLELTSIPSWNDHRIGIINEKYVPLTRVANYAIYQSTQSFTGSYYNIYSKQSDGMTIVTGSSGYYLISCSYVVA